MKSPHQLPVISLEIRKGKPAVTSLQVAKHFGKEHFNVLRDVRSILESDEDGFGTLNFEVSSYLSEQNKEMPMYAMSKDGFVLLVMGYTGPEAMRMKKAFIAKFNEMEAALLHPALPDFSNPVAAARAWADAMEQQQKAERALAEAVPKAAFVDRYVDTEGLRTLTQVAKTVKVKRADLIGILSAARHIYRDRWGTLQPYADRVKAGLYASKEGMVEGTEHSYSQMYVTPKGIETISRLLFPNK